MSEDATDSRVAIIAWDVAVTQGFLSALGVRDLPALTSPFDPGYAPSEIESHLAQSAHLMATLKLSMACWQIADEAASRAKIAAAQAAGVEVTTGGGPFEVAVARGLFGEYLELCAEMGFDRIECGEGFTTLRDDPKAIVERARAAGLRVQYELGPKHEGPITNETIDELVGVGTRWLDAGAIQLVVEARESAADVGLFDRDGRLSSELAEVLAERFGLDILTFEAPNKASQFAFMSLLGPEVRLSNVRIEELLRVEIYRRGLHSDAFQQPNLTPPDSIQAT